MSPYSLSFSVVTYNSEKYIGKLLQSIFDYVKGIDYHIFVIDNGSSDSTVNIVKSYGSHVTIIESGKNIGFGAAHNSVIEKLDSRYHVIVNPDIYFDSNVVSAMASYLDENPDIGMISPKILYPDGRLQPQAKRDPKFIYLVSRRMSLGCLKKYRDRYEMLSAGENDVFDIEFASGCFMFMCTALFKKIGGFDTRYFLYFEDADLSRELRQHARIEYNPRFCVYHNWERGGASHLGLLIKQIVSMFRYLIKWRKA